ncbi:hypothetical protein [Pseudomonas syringae group genomosp. 7]|uniref:hypothetical protein n=1 Tax=Pseudomonas syringae group genomosp. 7 TaxID=251699 RepID=UPI000EFE7BE5|nr:hypothetical protein [Pseudomonas syringae group genomosp. 7]
MELDIYRDKELDRILIIESGRTIPTMSDEGAKFLKDLKFHRTVTMDELPNGIYAKEVMQSVNDRGYYAGRQLVTITEVKIED